MRSLIATLFACVLATLSPALAQSGTEQAMTGYRVPELSLRIEAAVQQIRALTQSEFGKKHYADCRAVVPFVPPACGNFLNQSFNLAFGTLHVCESARSSYQRVTAAEWVGLDDDKKKSNIAMVEVCETVAKFSLQVHKALTPDFDFGPWEPDPVPRERKS